MVVSKLIALAAQELHASLDEFSTLAEIKKDHYDVVIVDDSALSFTLNQSIQKILARCTIVLYSNATHEIQHYDVKLKKPFLPKDLIAVVMKKVGEESLLEEPKSAYKSLESSSSDLIEKILEIEPSKIREILQGAKVSITIEFPKESQ